MVYDDLLSVCSANTITAGRCNVFKTKQILKQWWCRCDLFHLLIQSRFLTWILCILTCVFQGPASDDIILCCFPFTFTSPLHSQACLVSGPQRHRDQAWSFPLGVTFFLWPLPWPQLTWVLSVKPDQNKDRKLVISDADASNTSKCVLPKSQVSQCWLKVVPKFWRFCWTVAAPYPSYKKRLRGESQGEKYGGQQRGFGFSDKWKLS